MFLRTITKLILILHILRLFELVEPKRTLNIYKGKASKMDVMPYVCNIFVINGTHLEEFDYYDYSSCPGSYISAHWILTAAHCFGTFAPPTQVKAIDKAPPQEIRICMGTFDSDVDICDNQRKADRVVIHENWFETGDMALLHIKDPFKTGKNIKIVKIPHKYMNILRVYRNEKCLIGGWGIINKKKDIPSGFQTATVLVYPKKCPLHKRMICAKGLSGSGCAGDSGSPLVCGDTQIGVFTVGDQETCDNKNNEMFFERIDRHAAWLTKYIGASRPSSTPNCFIIAVLSIALKFI